MTTTYSKTIAERDAALHEDMKRAINVVKENSKPKKRWYEYLGVKPVAPRFTFIIKDRPVFTEQELAERRAFLDGYDSGRVDGDSHKAYKLWKQMRDSDK